MLSRIKKDDTVLILSGKDKGKQGPVISVNLKLNEAIVKDIGIITKHLKAKKSDEVSRIVKEERPIPLCKIMPICPSCKKACRVQIKFMEQGAKARTCHRCKEAF